MNGRTGEGRVGFSNLTVPERFVAAICLLYPFRILIAAGTHLDLHLGLVSGILLTLVALASVRERPAGFPSPLDVGMIGFAAVAIVDLFALSGPTALAVKGFSVETRFIVFYFLARFLRLRRELAVWLLTATLVLATLAAALGAIEYHLGWGWLLDLFNQIPDRRFWKMGLPRLYSFPMTPVSAAYLFLLGIAAALYFVERRQRRLLVVCAVMAIWQALPLTLTRSATALVIVITLVAALSGGLAQRQRLWFGAVSLAAALGGALGYCGSGWNSPLASYAVSGTLLADGSAQSHLSVIQSSGDLILARPLGYGFGQAGHLAQGGRGIFPFDDTHYVTLALQMGAPGLLAFLVVVVLAGVAWLGTARRADAETRALGFAGLAIWLGLTMGGTLLPTWNMITPQLYFWILTGVLENVTATGDSGKEKAVRYATVATGDAAGGVA